MKNIITTSILVLVISINAQAAELSSTIGFTNDYRFRGVSQTAGDPAVQGSIDVSFDNGISAGIWGSNIDFGDDANVELDYYVGYAGSINDEITYDATLLYFQYAGHEAADIDFYELRLGAHYKGISLLYATTNDWVNSSESAQYVSVGYSYQVSGNVSLNLRTGHSYGDYWDGIRDFNDYTDYSIGLSGQVYGLDLSLAYIGTKMDSGDDVDSGAFQNDGVIEVIISRTF